MCCQPCLPNFQCFPSCASWTPLCIFSFCYASHAVVSGTYPTVAVSKAWSKVLITVGWVWWRYQRGPFLVLSRAPSTLHPPLLTCFGMWCKIRSALLQTTRRRLIPDGAYLHHSGKSYWRGASTKHYDYLNRALSKTACRFCLQQNKVSSLVSECWHPLVSLEVIHEDIRFVQDT